MNVKTILLIVVSCCIWPLALNGQESEKQVQPNTANPFAIIFNRIDDLQKTVSRAANWIARQSHKQSSRRKLIFPVGRYWVDEYSRLIDRADQDIGMWGVDAPTSTHVPMYGRR